MAVQIKANVAAANPAVIRLRGLKFMPAFRSAGYRNWSKKGMIMMSVKGLMLE